MMPFPGLPFFTVDTFTNEIFKGNPAAVVLLDKELSTDVMQSIANEFNLSETAFILDTGKQLTLRWFTPNVEIDLCGHATIASAFVLWHEQLHSRNIKIHFSTCSGMLEVSNRENRYWLNFPSHQVKVIQTSEDMLHFLGMSPAFLGITGNDYLIELETEQQVRGFKPDIPALSGMDVRAIMVTARSESPQYDFVARFFAPRLGINEDPVTGSAYCALAPYWEKKLNKGNLTAYQASSRGGLVCLQNMDNRVLIGGDAILVSKGEFYVE